MTFDLPSIHRAVLIHGDVTQSLILGDGNQVILADGGSLAQRWLAWQGDPAEARRAYLEVLAARLARHIFPLAKLSFQAALEQLYQPLALTPYFGEWRPSLRRAREQRSLEDLLTAASPCALTGLLGEGKSTALRYLTWVYAARPEGRFLPGLSERLPFLVTARTLQEKWQQNPDPLAAWAQAVAADSRPLWSQPLSIACSKTPWRKAAPCSCSTPWMRPVCLPNPAPISSPPCAPFGIPPPERLVHPVPCVFFYEAHLHAHHRSADWPQPNVPPTCGRHDQAQPGDTTSRRLPKCSQKLPKKPSGRYNCFTLKYSP